GQICRDGLGEWGGGDVCVVTRLRLMASAGTRVDVGSAVRRVSVHLLSLAILGGRLCKGVGFGDICRRCWQVRQKNRYENSLFLCRRRFARSSSAPMGKERLSATNGSDQEEEVVSQEC